MNVLRIDVGVHTLLHINLSNVDFTGIKGIVFTVKNSPDVESPVIIERTFTETGYKFKNITLNAADYGVPQKRERVFLFGTRLDVEFEAPLPTHGEGRDIILL